MCLGCAHGAAPAATTRADVQRAEAALAVKDYDAAAAAYDRAVAGAPDAASRRLALTERADFRLLTGDLATAAADLAAVTELAPDDARAWHDLGIVRANLGDRPGAAAALTRAKAAGPDDPRPRLSRAALRWADGDRAGARVEYQALLDLDLPDPVRAKVTWAIDQLQPRE